METIFLKKLNCYVYHFLSNEELKKLYDYLKSWQNSNKIFRKDLSMFYSPEKSGEAGFLRVVDEKYYYRVYLDEKNFKKVGEIVKKGAIL